MPCYSPLTAWRNKNGSVQFKAGGAVGFSFQLPCGQCIGCRLERSRQWAVRVVYENSLHEDSCFVTLTYSPEHIPADGGLCSRHLQLFLKRLRKHVKTRIRFFACGEYGEHTLRPHYHAIIFGWRPDDLVIYKESATGATLYSSDVLDSIWALGNTRVGDVSFQSAAYVSRYVLKKRTGRNSDKYYERVIPETGEVVRLQPEFVRMSLKPGIGAGWFDKFSGDVYPSDFVVVNGVKQLPPKFFDRKLEISNPSLLEQLKLKRIAAASKFKADNTPERLGVKRKVQEARLNFLTRHKEV